MTDQAHTIPAVAHNDEVIPFVHEQHQGIIRKLLITEEPLVRDHLLRLDAESRRRRFFREVSDDFLRDYAMKFAELGTIIYGYIVEGEVRAVAELKRVPFNGDLTGEAAFSVEKAFTNHGIGTQLMGRIILSARNRGLKHLMIMCLPDNAKMRAIAAKYSSELLVEDGASVADIVPKAADYKSYASEVISDRLGFMQALFDLDRRILKTLSTPVGNSNEPDMKDIAV
jgi:RimJ/RimL family protein N-acetyltransferase